MGDAADLLGIQKANKTSNNDPLSIMSGVDKHSSQKLDKKKKPKGMSREVFNLMGADGIAPSIQTNVDVKVSGFKNKRQSNTQGKWVWAEYHSSARSDSQPFYHWVKADLQNFDYVYAKFNTKLDPITYSNDEYDSILKVPNWTKSETDQLMSVCHEYNLRWPVIADRFETTCHRTTEDLMARYYYVATQLKLHKNEKRTGNFSNQVIPSSTFDVEFERCRRKQQDILYKMTPEDHAEELALREELKTLEANIKKMKKSIKQTPPPPPPTVATGTKSTTTGAGSKKKNAKDQTSALSAPTAASIAAASSGGSVAASVLLKPMPPIVMYGGVMKPAPNQPCLQSARLSFTNDLPDFSKKTVTGFEGTSNLDLSEPFIAKLKHYSQEVGMPDRLLPTRAVCDLHDQVRRDMVILLSLQGKISRNEEKLNAIREHNPGINSLAYENSGNSHTFAPECRVTVPDTAFLVKESDTAGMNLPAVKPYIPAAPLLLVPPPPVPVDKSTTNKDKNSSATGTKANKAAGGATTDASGKPTKKASKSKRKAADISKEGSPTSSNKQPAATQEPKTKKSTAQSKPTVKKINPVLAKAATIPIPPLNNTPQSIAIAAAANAVKAKLAAEQKAASEGTHLSQQKGSGVSSSNSNSPLNSPTKAISAAVKAATTGGTNSNVSATSSPSSSSSTVTSATQESNTSVQQNLAPIVTTKSTVGNVVPPTSSSQQSVHSSPAQLTAPSVNQERDLDATKEDSKEPSLKKAKTS